ncbi:MAG: manganese efflux pump [Bacillota bacterium]|nr:manganese efflux pump [Bacillota bacterium]
MFGLNFVITNILLGVGLAMDTFSVSIVNTLNEPDMPKKKMCGMSFVYAAFQAIMPLIGWFCVHTIIEYFKAVQPFIPWVALILLLYIGGKMLLEGLGVIKGDEEEGVQSVSGLTIRILIIQGIATAIDALSVGFTIAEYDFTMAFVAALIIAVVTYIISMIGALIGKKMGNRLSSKASILGGIILIFIGLKICFF